MFINAQTKIAALLKQHPDALETIVSIAPDFKKLRNPILRRIMAGRTSIAMASKVGGCKPEDFFKALAPLGFQVDANPTMAIEEAIEDQPMPEYLRSISQDSIVPFDVRQLLASGNDPLKEIQQKVKALNPGEVLLIINNFEPVPLIKLLEKQGFLSYVKHVSEDTIETWFYKTQDSAQKDEPANAEPELSGSGDWDQILRKYENNLQEIDVRHLEMPMPMITILEALEELPEEMALYVHHKRIPVFLLTELKDRNFEYRIKEIQAGEVYLLIFKNI
ncbi:MAG TPA: DUF2249 domain-containing protein [Niabella sp.]|nr:DUF2249 domain-containing protein [Niabella sp.]HOZ97044.1 DUF2249 domain-containing protein [Niabella sp.]HQW15034.1 DUF2249 domain-containing protein [Niabella sp.]HQX20074.1 DUF2249 domain-containing protein [Niabella sp.]HQX40414.1 DUF2249 domain-containing protein [Niabella sp.]